MASIPCLDNTTLTIMQLTVTALVLWAIYTYIWEAGQVDSAPTLVQLGRGALPPNGGEALRGAA